MRINGEEIDQSRQAVHHKFFSRRIFCLGYTVGVENQNIAGFEVDRVGSAIYVVEHPERPASVGADGVDQRCGCGGGMDHGEASKLP